jgi:hypothetical protein
MQQARLFDKCLAGLLASPLLAATAEPVQTDIKRRTVIRAQGLSLEQHCLLDAQARGRTSCTVIKP